MAEPMQPNFAGDGFYRPAPPQAVPSVAMPQQALPAFGGDPGFTRDPRTGGQTPTFAGQSGPTFGAAPGVVAARPMTPGAPMVPQFQPPSMPGMQPPSTGNKWGELASVIPALLAGIKDPVVAGAALAGLQQGRDRKRQLMLGDEAHARELQNDRARFYSDALTHAQQFDDEISLHQYLAGIKPMADYYGVSLDGMTISNEKKSAKDRKLVSEAVDRAVKLHGPEILNNDQASIQLGDGRTFSMPVARQLLGGDVTQAGKSLPVGVPPKTDVPNTPEEQTLASFAKEHGYKGFADMPVALQTEARQTARESIGGPQRVEGLLDGKTAFAFQRGTKFYDSNNQEVTGRFRPLQTTQERQAVSDAAASVPAKPLEPGTADYQAAQDLAYGALTFQQFARLYPSRAKNDDRKSRIYLAARQLNPSFNPAEYEAGFKMYVNPQNRNRLTAIDGLMPIIDKIDTLSSQVGNGDVQAFNRLLNAAKVQVSNQQVANFQQLKTLLGDEVGLALGVGNASDLKTKLGLDVVNTNLSDGSFQSSMQQLRDILTGRRQNLLKPMGVYGDAAGGSGNGGRASGANPFRK